MNESTSAVVLDILSQVLETPAEDLREQPELEAHGWDSMSSLEALGRLESRFGARLDLGSVTEARTPEEIVAMIGGDQ